MSLMPPLLSLLLSCATAPAAPPAPPAPMAPLQAPSLEAWYPGALALLDGCVLSGEAGMSTALQVSCPGDRVITDMRGPGAPGPATAVDATLGMLRELGLEGSPRQATALLPGEGAPGATILDAQGPDLQVTVWVVSQLAAMPQTLSCMATAGDAEAATWCPAALAAMLLPPAPQVTLPPKDGAAPLP